MIYFGYIAFSISMGLLLGASNTPVVGTFMTSFLSLISAIIGAIFLIDDKSDKVKLSKFIGTSLVVISIGLILGTFLGEQYRTFDNYNKHKNFVWINIEEPESTYEAIDWIILKENMINRGYSEDQIKDLYLIRQKEVKSLKLIIDQENKSVENSYDHTVIYDDSKPFNILFSDILTSQKPSRGPANVN